MKNKLILFFLFLFGINSLFAQEIKVLIGCKEEKFYISSTNEIKVCDLDEKLLFSLKKDQKYPVFIQEGKINIANQSLEVSGVILISLQPIEIDKNKYRDRIILYPQGAKILVVNQIDIEKYLWGVLNMEVSSTWPVEALKAQAVVARTYALKMKEQNFDKIFHLDATQDSQVYGGVNAEDEIVINAVNKTNGVVITYNDELIYAYFHSCCGGYTELPENVWEMNPLPYYKKLVKCPYCKESPYYLWRVELKKDEIKKKLNSAGYEIKKIEKIKISGINEAERANQIQIYGLGKQISLSAHKFRRIIGPEVIRSTFFSIQNQAETIIFEGKGWGHGVGMCQWGAKGLAEKGKNYKEIINYYYPEANIKRWN